MELSTTRQLLELASAVGTGIGLGMIYDVFRVLRRCSGRFPAAVWDVCFCLVMAPILFWLGMGPGGGSLRFYMPAAAAAGAGLHFAFFSPLLLGMLMPLARAAEKAAGKFRKLVKTIGFHVKKNP